MATAQQIAAARKIAPGVMGSELERRIDNGSLNLDSWAYQEVTEQDG